MLETLGRREYCERIPVRIDDHIELVDVDDIVWIKASRNTVQIHLAARSVELRETMASLADGLDPRHFARVHRSAIVNVRRIKAIHPWFNGYHVVVMDTGQELRMGALRRSTGSAIGADLSQARERRQGKLRMRAREARVVRFILPIESAR